MGRIADRLAAQVLEQERHTGERPIGQPVADQRPRLVRHGMHDRIEFRIEPFGARQRLVQQFLRLHLLAPDQIGQTQRII